MEKHNNSRKKSEQPSKRAKARGPVQRDTKEVLAELVGKLKEKLDPKKVTAMSAGEKHQQGELRPNLDRLTVGVDLGDQWSHYCILGLEGETLAEGQLRTTPQDVAEFFEALNAARVVVEVGTHSAWVQEVIRGYGHEVLVANPRLMEGSKRRKRKNDRIDANKLARLGRVDPQSLHPIEHRSPEVRQDCVGGGGDGADQCHARTGEEYGHTAPQMFQPELRTKGRGDSSRRDPRSAAATRAYDGGAERWHPGI